MTYKRNITLKYVSKMFSSMIFHSPIIVIYLLNIINMTQVMILTAFQTLIIAIMEVPTGVFADIYSRKSSIIFGKILFALGILIVGLSTSFWTLLIAFLLIGVGQAFTSGAGTAIFYDTLKRLRKSKKMAEISGNISFYSRIVRAFSAVIAGVIASRIGMRFNFYITSFLLFLSALTYFFFKEPPLEKKINSYELQVRKSIKFLVSNKNLLLILFSTIIFGIIQEVISIYRQPLILSSGISITYFGLIYAALIFIKAVGEKYSYKLKKFSPRKSLLFMTLSLAACSMILSFIKKPIILLLVFGLSTMLWGFQLPLVKEYVNSLIPSNKRSTILSFNMLLFSIVYTFISPFFGWVSDTYSIQASLIVCALILVFSLLIIRLISGLNKQGVGHDAQKDY